MVTSPSGSPELPEGLLPLGPCSQMGGKAKAVLRLRSRPPPLVGGPSSGERVRLQ